MGRRWLPPGFRGLGVEAVLSAFMIVAVVIAHQWLPIGFIMMILSLSLVSISVWLIGSIVANRARRRPSSQR